MDDRSGLVDVTRVALRTCIAAYGLPVAVRLLADVAGESDEGTPIAAAQGQRIADLERRVDHLLIIQSVQSQSPG